MQNAGVLGLAALDDELPLADVIVLLAPLLPETRHLVDASFIAKASMHITHFHSLLAGMLCITCMQCHVCMMLRAVRMLRGTDKTRGANHQCRPRAPHQLG